MADEWKITFEKVKWDDPHIVSGAMMEYSEVPTELVWGILDFVGNWNVKENKHGV